MPKAEALSTSARWADAAGAREREILTVPLPRADDVSIAAQEEQGLQLRAAQSALAEARRAEKQLARTGGLSG